MHKDMEKNGMTIQDKMEQNRMANKKDMEQNWLSKNGNGWNGHTKENLSFKKRFKMMDYLSMEDNIEFVKIDSLEDKAYRKILQIIQFFWENRNQLNGDAILGLDFAAGKFYSLG